MKKHLSSFKNNDFQVKFQKQGLSSDEEPKGTTRMLDNMDAGCRCILDAGCRMSPDFCQMMPDVVVRRGLGKCRVILLSYSSP